MDQQMEDVEEEQKESEYMKVSEPITPQKTNQILAFLEDLRSDPQAAAFNMPVHWRALNIPDYPRIVKNPMDLQTLELKVRGQYILQSEQKCEPYQYVHEFVRDLNLIWSNCKLFNQIGSLIYRNAQAMVRTSDRLLYKYKVLTRASLDEDLDDMAREFN